MNQELLIRNTINSYSDFPKVQADMRKILKYASSQNRMFLQPLIDNEPALSPELAALDASTEAFEASEAFTAEVGADALTISKAVVAEMILRKSGSFTAAKDELALKYASAPRTFGYLAEVATYILREIMALTAPELHALQSSND
jgi:hypothetical protein